MIVPLLVNQFLQRAVSLYGKKTAIVCEDGTRLTYRDWQNRVNQWSNALRQLGVKKGDRVAYLAPNSHPMLEASYAVTQIGAIMVPLNTRLVGDDYAYILNHSGSKVLCADADLVEPIEKVRRELKTVEHFVLLPSPSATSRPGWLSYDNLLKEQPTAIDNLPSMDENDVATLLYTSGTTGKPKGVMATHRNLYMNAIHSILHLRMTDRDVLLHTLPLFHVNGWGAPFSLTGVGGTHVCLRKIDPPLIYRLIEKEGITLACMAPTVLNMLINSPARETYTVNNDMRVVLAGSAPPPAFVKIVEEELGWEFIQVYGMTECSPFLTVSYPKSTMLERPKEDYYRYKAKTGYPMLGVELRVVNEEGKDVAANGREVGEVIARSNVVMKGYWNQPEETAAAIQDGWYHTGDMATIDEEGYIEIVDRKKDIIISGGENISSIEVEGILYEHPAVLEAAVIAVPHEKWGELPHAVIVRREGHEVSEEEIIQYCRNRMAHFKAPKSVQFVSELPKTASGKIQKGVLREQFWGQRSRKVN